jgi:hypothetical protein
MKPVKTKPRFKCDFCNFKATEPTVEKHEVICWKNPNRYCKACGNTGIIKQIIDVGLVDRIDCYYCSQKHKDDIYKDEIFKSSKTNKLTKQESRLLVWLKNEK